MANIVLRLSGGATNTVANDSLGGVKSLEGAAEITTSDTTLNNLFDNVSKAENFAGDTNYRCIYIENIAGSGTFSNGEVYLTGTPLADIAVGFGPEGDGGIDETAELVADETTAPAGVAFSQPTDLVPLSFPSYALVQAGDTTLGEGSYIALWIRRIADNIPGSDTVTDTIGLSVRGVE
jgi:hypothetical protein